MRDRCDAELDLLAQLVGEVQRIAEEVLKVTRQPSAAYLFTTEDRIEPTLCGADPDAGGAAARR